MRRRSTISAWQTRRKRLRRFVVQLDPGMPYKDVQAVQRASLAEDMSNWANQQWGIWDLQRDDWMRRDKKTNAKGKPKVLAVGTEDRANHIAATMRQKRGTRYEARRLS